MAKVQLLGDKASGYQLTLDGEPFFIKGSDHPLEPEKHWGIYRADRSGKPALSLQL